MPPRQRDSDGTPQESEAKSTAELTDSIWRAMDKLRGSFDTIRYQDIVLSLVFLRHLSVAFDERRAELTQEVLGLGIDEDRLDEFLDDKDEYTSAHTFWLPPIARWSSITAPSPERSLRRRLDDAVNAIRRRHSSLTDVLSGLPLQSGIDEVRLTELVGIIDEIRIDSADGEPVRSPLPYLYEALLLRFARAMGPGGGEFHTPPSVALLITRLLQPLGGRVYDPTCGTGSLLVEAAKYSARHRRTAGPMAHVALFGQEVNDQSWRLAKMNLAIHGLDGSLADRPEDTLTNDQHPDIKADFVMAHPPFDMSLRSVDPTDNRWRYGVASTGNANYAWLQHVISKLDDHGTACVFLPSSSMSSRTPRDRQIRGALIEADLVAAMVALPEQLFPHAKIPTCLWVLAKDKAPYPRTGRNDRRDQILFIDARTMGSTADGALRVLRPQENATIVDTYRSWRGTSSARRRDGPYRNERGFCFSGRLDAVRDNGYTLTPEEYVRAYPTIRERTGPPPTKLTKDLYGLFE
ncbi:N-6 DNA methylase [Kitasatospora sp. NPDC056273]|uniref:type I restriction-modification system subunit M n=1 Tax=Kitasatospora sp. NPDC056273 TaxID=3345769 RepID=UPI0035DC59F7